MSRAQAHPHGGEAAMAWWLEAGAGTCASCEARQHYEALVYCVTCDRPLCLLCVVELRRSRAPACAGCRPGIDEGEG